MEDLDRYNGGVKKSVCYELEWLPFACNCVTTVVDDDLIPETSCWLVGRILSFFLIKRSDTNPTCVMKSILVLIIENRLQKHLRSKTQIWCRLENLLTHQTNGVCSRRSDLKLWTRLWLATWIEGSVSAISIPSISFVTEDITKNALVFYT